MHPRRGTHPNVRCWHFPWLAVRAPHHGLRRVLPGLRGRLLDVGCDEKPYAWWFPRGKGDRVVGIDVSRGPGVDVVVGETGGFPFRDGAFDAVLCTQVLEHVGDIDSTLGEFYRVLAPSGLLLAWMHGVWERRTLLRLLKLPLLPAGVAAVLAANGIGFLLGKLDRADAFYGNAMVVARKRPAGG